MTHSYRVLSIEDRATLRMERVKALEADLFRAELAFEDALSNVEREALGIEMEAFRVKLDIQYQALGILKEVEGSPSDDEDPRS